MHTSAQKFKKLNLKKPQPNKTNPKNPRNWKIQNIADDLNFYPDSFQHDPHRYYTVSANSHPNIV